VGSLVILVISVKTEMSENGKLGRNAKTGMTNYATSAMEG
jgi:hypothetical protein